LLPLLLLLLLLPNCAQAIMCFGQLQPLVG
jgi:hypothetical protein